MNPKPETSSVATDMRRRFGRAVKPLALLVASSFALGGLTLVQSWMSSQPAQAADATVNWVATGFTEFNPNRLYHARIGRTTEIANPKASNNADAGITEPIYNQTGTTGWATPAPDAMSTIAIGPDTTQGGNPNQKVAWHWAWEGTTIAVKKVVPGQNIAREYRVSQALPARSGTDYRYYSGGEASQMTGKIYFSPAEGNVVSNTTVSSARMQVCDPRGVAPGGTMPCVRAAGLQPATTADRLIADNGNATYTWTIGSDMALDAEGAAYLMASYGAATTVTNGPYGRYLIKVTPGADGAVWNWQIVTKFTPPYVGEAT
jgi:hypothetical protein